MQAPEAVRDSFNGRLRLMADLQSFLSRVACSISHMSRKLVTEDEPCGMDLLQRAIAGKWKLSIIWMLSETRRFGELKRLFPFVTQAMLTKHLRELEADGFVHREIYREVPPRVEYSLTDLGMSFLPIIEHTDEWADGHRAEMLGAFEAQE